MIMQYWDIIHQKVSFQAIKEKDKPIIQLMNRIKKVPEGIREAVATHYLTQCQHLAAIAFFQWRYIFPKESYYFDDRALSQSIQFHVNRFFKPIDKKLIENETLDGSKLTDKFYTKYKFWKTKNNNPFIIDDFEVIRIADPYAHEDDPESDDELIKSEFFKKP